MFSFNLPFPAYLNFNRPYAYFAATKPNNIFVRMKALLTGILIILLGLTAWQFFSFPQKPTNLNEQVLENGLEKIKVRNIINPSLTANEAAFIDEQGAHQLINGKSNPGITPKSCGNWWDFSETNAASCIQLNYHPNRVGNTPDPVSYDFEFEGEYQLKKICIFIDPLKSSKNENSLQIKSGIPFKYNQTISQLQDNGTIKASGWVDIDCNVNTQYLQLIYGENFGAIREIVFYGSIIHKSPSINPYYSYNQKSFDSICGTNIIMQMGQSADGKNYDEGWNGGLRWFAAACYVLNKDLSLKDPYGTASELESNWNRRIIASGSKLHYAFGSLVDSSMVSATNNSGGDWANQKPIPTSLINEKTADRYEGICTFNEIADKPGSYAQAAYNLKRLAQGLYQLGHRAIEPDNEKDGTFKKAGFMYPYQQAAYLSALYDGHDNTLSFKGEPVGIRNSGLSTDQMKLIFPGLTYVNPTYIKAMMWWWKWNRKNGDAPFDIFNIHLYPSTLNITQHYLNAQAVMPESSVFNMEKKLDTAKYFAALMHKPLINTETGYDAYEEKLRYPNEFCNENVRWGNSFMAIRPFAHKTPEAIQGEWLLRTMLLHNSKGIPCYQFWLADQYKEGSVCGHFSATGFLKHDTVIHWKQLYIPRLAWFYLQCFKNRLTDFVWVKEIKENNLRFSFYENKSGAAAKHAVVYWSATDDGSSASYLFKLPSHLPYQLVTPNNTPIGKTTTGNGATVELQVKELPQIIFY